MSHPQEPIVGRDEIRIAARDAAEREQPLHESNPYAPGTHACDLFERDYWQRHRELQAETTT